MPGRRRGRGSGTTKKTPVRTSKEEIQRQAVELFLKKGYHGTSTTDICDAAGISRPTLYWHFKDKEDLLFSLHKESIERSLQPMTATAVAQPDPVLRLKRFVTDLTDLICTDRGAKIFVKETEYLNPAHREWVAENWKAQYQMLRGTIAELKAAGLAKDVSETFMAFSLLGMITWAYNWFDYDRPDAIARLANDIQEVFLSGLLKPGADGTPEER